jgi:hypothetical protein
VRAGVDRLSTELSDWAARDAGATLRLTQPPLGPAGGLAQLSVTIGALEQQLAGLRSTTSAEQEEREILTARLAEVRFALSRIPTSIRGSELEPHLMSR